MVKTFIQWAEETNKDLSGLLAEVEPTDGTEQHENGVRTGIGPQYPDGYVRSQYPQGYFAPTKATWKLDTDNAKKKVMKNAPGTAPA